MAVWAQLDIDHLYITSNQLALWESGHKKLNHVKNNLQ